MSVDYLLHESSVGYAVRVVAIDFEDLTNGFADFQSQDAGRYDWQ